MPLYEIAFGSAIVFFAALSFMQVMMRQQVHHARFGDQAISPSDVRFSNNLFGQYGIWNLHKRAYERSALRYSFVAASMVFLVSINRGRLRLPLRSPRTLTSLLSINCHRLTNDSYSQIKLR
jgi:hypothetical protein